MFNRFVFRDVGGSASYSPLFKRDPLIIGGAIAGASALINGYLQHRANKQNIQNQNALWNEQLRQQNFLNANGALIQRQALQRAGLNPNAEFGTSANLQSPTPQKSDVVAPRLDTQGIAQMIQQQQLIDAQAENLKANTGKTEAETNKINEETKQVIQETANLLETNGILKFQNETQRDQFSASMANMLADTDLKSAQTYNVNRDSDLKELEYKLEDASLDTRKEIYVATLNDLIASKDLKESEKALAVARVNESVANASFTSAQERRLDKLLDEEYEGLQLDNEVKRQQKLFVKAQATFVTTQEQWFEYTKMLEGLGHSKKFIEQMWKYPPFSRFAPKGLKGMKGGIR